MSKTLPPQWVLAFRAEPNQPDGPDAAIRVRMLLKHAKRSLGLICTSVSPDWPTDLPAPDPALDVERTEPPFAADQEPETTHG
ncbi:MAG TPA: hypothetical protein VHR72_08630 [Gemmataceae bacterium]|jgi:hypothetical protein|nr:hypothetical protein [Gemmataceae bacterium]